MTTFKGRVRDAGGGVVEILVDRDTAEYPPVNADVVVTVQPWADEPVEPKWDTDPHPAIASALTLLDRLADAAERLADCLEEAHR